MHYIKPDQIISMVLKHGPGALMAKFDVEAAYRNIAVHPDDRYLLGMKWRGLFFVDLALPFGLRSAPYIFNLVADMVEWIILNRYNVADLMHYLDDFLTAGPAGSNQCAQNLQTSLAVCRSLGLPLHPGKCIGPHTRLVVLGIELDSIEQSARLPAEKLAKLQELIHSWRSRRWCTRRQLESLIGHLHHAAKVVWPGRTFLRRMIDLLCCFRARDHPIRLNSEFQLDVQWWHEFLASWHGVSFWLFPACLGFPVVSAPCPFPIGYYELDSIEQSARLPAEKLAKLQELIHSWRSRRWYTRRQLESLIGHLHHAAKVVWPGRTFLRRMIDLLCCFRTRDHPIRLNSEFQLDVQWWQSNVGSLFKCK